MEKQTKGRDLSETEASKSTTERLSVQAQVHSNGDSVLENYHQPHEDEESIARPKPESSATLEPEPGHPDAELPFSIFTRREKILIVTLASLAALFSPLSANIYYSALNTLARDLDVSNTLINLSITTYLIFQGLAPTFVGSISDAYGRRPLYIACFVVYLGANIGLALQTNYAALMVLRCVQSSGSSGTVALASGVISDIATSAQRGSYISYVQAGALLGPAFAPVIGGLLNHFLGWRSVFRFLTIFAGVTFVFIVGLFPETCRAVVGNGSSGAQRWNVSLFTYYLHRKQRKSGEGPVQETRQTRRKSPNLLKSLRIVFDKESGLVLLYCGLLFSGFYMILTSMPSLFLAKYNFNTLQIGLCYLPTGFGSLTAALLGGRFLDWNFQRHARRCGLEVTKTRQQDLRNFPLELARLQIVLPLVGFGCAMLLACSWVMQARTSVAAPLVLLYFAAFSLSGSFQGMSTLIVDMNRTSAGAATAAMNLVRCWMGAGATALVVPLTPKIGIGWTGVFVVGVLGLLSPIVWVVITYGPRWRKEKEEKMQEGGGDGQGV